MRRSKLAASLLRLRRGGALIGEIPAVVMPATAASAYGIADEIVAALEPTLGAVSGYKIGATSEAGQRMLHLEEPFYGRVFGSCILASGKGWSIEGPGCSVEAEVGFVIGRTLAPRREPYSEAQVRGAVARVVPLLEINRPAYAKPFSAGGLCLIADNGVTRALVRTQAGRALGRLSFRNETVSVAQNGRAVAAGGAVVVMGDPLHAVTWLANVLSRQGRSLRAGDVVASGAMTPPIAVLAGDVIVATYSTLGKVKVMLQSPANRARVMRAREECIWPLAVR